MSNDIFQLRARLLVGAGLPVQVKNKLINQNPGTTMEKVDELLALDPTPKGSWMSWLIKWDKQNKLPENVTQLITKFERLKNGWKPDDPRRNFGQFTPDQLTEMLSGGKDLTRQERRALPKNELKERLFETGLPGAKLLINDGTWKVWRVTNEKYEMLLSCADMSNADAYCAWCTKHEGYCKDYLKNGPIWPIYKNGEPFAQAHIGGGGDPSQESMASVPIILLDRRDKKMELSKDLLELFEVLKPLPDYKFFEKYVWMSISQIPDDPELLELVKQYIEENEDNRLRVLFLKKHYWPEALMGLLEDDYERGLKAVMQDATPEVKAQIMASEFAPEVMLYVDKVTASMFPAFAEQGAFAKYFELPQSGSTKLKFGKLDQKIGKRFIAWILGQDRATFASISNRFEMDEAFATGPLAAYWKKNLAPEGKLFGGPAGKLLEQYIPEYAQLAEERKGQVIALSDLPPTLEMGEEVKRGPSWDEGTNDGGPQNTGLISFVGTGGHYRVDWNGGRKGWNVHYMPPSLAKDNGDNVLMKVVPLNADYEPSGNEPVPIKPLIETPEERQKRHAQPVILAVGDLVVRGPDWWDGDYDMDRGTHQPGFGKVIRVGDSGESGQSVRVKWDNGNNEGYYYNYPDRLDVVKRSVWTGEPDPEEDAVAPGVAPPPGPVVEGTQLGAYPPGTRVNSPIEGTGTVLSREQAQAAHYDVEAFGTTEFLVRWHRINGVDWYSTSRSDEDEHNTVGFMFTEPASPSDFRVLRVGDRVTSGPDWDDDDDGPRRTAGEVTELDDSDALSVYVEWDDDTSSWYQYGPNFINRDEDDECSNQIMPLPGAAPAPETPEENEEDEEAESEEDNDDDSVDNEDYHVGARVRRGSEWQFGDQDTLNNEQQIGTIQRINGGVCYVKWDGLPLQGNYGWDYFPETQIQLAE